MARMKLSLDALEVESFETSRVRSVSGTVNAHAYEAVPEDAEYITTPYTQQKTCPYTCMASCGGTCNESCQTCPLGNTCMTGCFDTCPTGGLRCCA